MKSTNTQINKPKEIDPVDIPSYIGMDRNRFRNLVAAENIIMQEKSTGKL